MNSHEHFEIQVGAGVVRGSMRKPENGATPPVVVMCGDPMGSAINHGSLLLSLAEHLNKAGIAAVSYDARRDDPEALKDARSLGEDADAVLRWTIERHDIDTRRIGVLGCCLGAIASAALAARDERVNRLCLLAPVIGEDVLNRIEKANGLPTLVDPLALSGAFLASLAELSPTQDVARRRQPTLIVRGAADRIVPASSTKPYVDAVELAEHPGHLELIARAGHELTSGEGRAVRFARIARFFADMAAPPSAS